MILRRAPNNANVRAHLRDDAAAAKMGREDGLLTLAFRMTLSAVAYFQ
jgi:hypothetical protein